MRTIEHGNLLDAEAAKVMADHGAFLVPTSVTYRALHGPRRREFGFPEVSMQKLGDVLEVGMRAIEIARDAGVRIGHGSDLLGECQVYQSDEFAIKAEVLGNHEAIRQATEVNADILNMGGELGVVRAGALADLVVVDGDPLADIGLLAGQGAHMPAIMKGGRFFKDSL